jgi:hypothetical protein
MPQPNLNPVQAALDARFGGRRASIEAADSAQKIVEASASAPSPAASAVETKPKCTFNPSTGHSSSPPRLARFSPTV